MLSLPNNIRIHSVFHVSQLKPVSTNALCPPAAAPPPPHIIDDYPAFTVNHLVNVQCHGQGLKYLVDWEDYGPEEHSWVPHSFILDWSFIGPTRISLGRLEAPLEGRVLLGLYLFVFSLSLSLSSFASRWDLVLQPILHTCGSFSPPAVLKLAPLTSLRQNIADSMCDHPSSRFLPRTFSLASGLVVPLGLSTTVFSSYPVLPSASLPSSPYLFVSLWLGGSSETLIPLSAFILFYPAVAAVKLLFWFPL